KYDKDMSSEDKRKLFLERNRQAAHKCRQRKKQWLNELQTRVTTLTSENERLKGETASLREEIVGLRTMLFAHKDCSVAQ
ncbi:hypothetical protein GQ42DRAFT_110764, partial [Ramicandelaber brevisporus]